VSFQLVQKFDVATWEDIWKVAVVNIDGYTLETFKFGFRIRLNNSEINLLSRVGEYHTNIYPVGQ